MPEESTAEYNYDHFTRRIIWIDAARTLATSGIAPGSPAPAFELPDTEGRAVRLSDFRGRPVVLHFGSSS